MPYINKITRRRKPPEYISEKRKLRSQYYAQPQWGVLRESKLSAEPLCEVCKAEGVINVANQVHHIVSPFQFEEPLRSNVFYDYNNLQSICATCHGKEHANRQKKD